MNDNDLAIGTALWVGGMASLNKLQHRQDPLPAILAAFLLGFFILVGAKASPTGAKWFALVVCTSAFLVNGNSIINAVNRLTTYHAPIDPAANPGNTPFVPGYVNPLPGWAQVPKN